MGRVLKLTVVPLDDPAIFEGWERKPPAVSLVHELLILRHAKRIPITHELVVVTFSLPRVNHLDEGHKAPAAMKPESMVDDTDRVSVELHATLVVRKGIDRDRVAVLAEHA